MKILIISNLFPPHYLGGYELLCQQVCQILHGWGHKITVLTSDHHSKTQKEEKFPYSVYRKLKLYLPFHRKAKLLRTRRSWFGEMNFRVTERFLRRHQPELVFMWSQLRLTTGAMRAVEESGIPTIYTFNDENIMSYQESRLSFSPLPFLRYLLNQIIFPKITLHAIHFTHATCISQLLKDNLLERGLPIDKARVIFQGIPVEKFPRKKKENASPEVWKILYVGQLHAYKGVDTLIKAAHLLCEQSTIPPCQFVIVGDGPEDYKESLKSLAKEGKAEIIFPGKLPHDELPALYRKHDIFVFSSIWQEPFGLTHLEAMASGVPVISTADGGHGEFLRHHENAWIFPKANEKILAERIEEVIKNPSQRKEITDYARNMVEKEFSLQRYVKDLEIFLQDVLKERA